MTNYTADEKYRNYEKLLRKDPLNELYKRKLQKHKNLLSNRVQKGGNNPNENPFAELMASEKSVRADTNTKSQTKTRELVSKIQNMLAYAQQTGNTMKGGADKKKNNDTNNSKKYKNQIKGQRKMVGGAKPGDPDYDPKSALADLGMGMTQERLQKQIQGQQDAAASIKNHIARLLERLATMGRDLSAANGEKDALQKQLDELTTKCSTEDENLARLEAQIERLNAEKADLIEALAILNIAHDKLKAEKLLVDQSNADLQREMGELTAASEAQLERLNIQIATLKTERDAANVQMAKDKQTITDLTAKLAKLDSDSDAAIKVLRTRIIELNTAMETMEREHLVALAQMTADVDAQINPIP